MTRRTSLPYPASPPQQHPLNLEQQNTNTQSDLLPDSADLPPVPLFTRRDPMANGSPKYEVSDNPWSDAAESKLRSDRPLPDILRPGNTPSTQNLKLNAGGDHSLSNIPQALRSGRSQEATPRSSIESDRSKDFWEDDSDEETGKRSPKKGNIALRDDEPLEDPWDNVESLEDRSGGIKRKPVGSGLTPTHTRPGPSTTASFASNNPFRRPSESQHIEQPDWSSPSTSSAKGKEPVRNLDGPRALSSQNLSFTAQDPGLSLYNGEQDTVDAWKATPPQIRPSMPPMPQAPPPAPPEALSPFSKQPPLIPVLPGSPRIPSAENPWKSHPPSTAPTPSPIPFAPSQKQDSMYNDDLLARGQQSGVVSLQDELSTLPNAAGTSYETQGEPSLLDDEEDDPPSLPLRPAHRTETEYFEPPEGPPPPKPPRPTVQTTVPSDEEIARMMEQRNETYQIKHFNWFDHSSKRMRRSSMLTQNKNGPCPLLALVNALILGAKDESQATLDDALRTREQVTLGLIIETLMDELLSRGFDTIGVMPDVDELNHFLMRLRTGMNANPRFVSQSIPAPNLMDADDDMMNVPQHERSSRKIGTFETTTDMKLYGAFQVPLVHGWLPEPGSDALNAFTRSAQTYEDAQALQFGEEELEYKIAHQQLTESEEHMWQDIKSIQNFFKNYPTQLTPTGLDAVRDSTPSGSFAIMFRNDHFSTIYKHPESGQLFTLITDAGYADRDEIIWESLIDISGRHNDFFSGDFMPVGNVESDESSTHPTNRHSSQFLSVANPATSAAPLSPQEVQEQHDADFAMALQLQEEEEQRQRAERNRRRSGGGSATNNNPPAQPPRRPGPQQGNIPITLSSSRPSQAANEVRPTIPPRNSHAAPNPAVNRPSDAIDGDAPPAYEEAAKGAPYIPPLGSPLHATSSPLASSTQLGGTTSHVSQHSASGSGSGAGMGGMGGQHPPGPNALRRPAGRRTSAYNEQGQAAYYGQQQGRLHPQSGISGGGMPGGMPVGVAGGRQRRDERDCTVM